MFPQPRWLPPENHHDNDEDNAHEDKADDADDADIMVMMTLMMVMASICTNTFYSYF